MCPRNLTAGKLILIPSDGSPADAPVCATDQDEVLGALKHETLMLKCDVDSSPPPTVFHWSFIPVGEQPESPTRLQSNEVGVTDPTQTLKTKIHLHVNAL